MKIFPYNTEIESYIKQIKKELLLSMNGISSERMQEYGIKYKKNYGLSILRIKELTTRYPRNHQLAVQLWALGYRETMIMATLIMSIESFTMPMAKVWIKDCHCSEICEQLSFNLLQNSIFNKSISIESISSDDTYSQICGLLTASRIAKSFNETETFSFIENTIRLSNTNVFELQHAISVSLRFFCRVKKENADYILTKIHTFENAQSRSQQYIFQEVKQEVNFLYDL